MPTTRNPSVPSQMNSVNRSCTTAIIAHLLRRLFADAEGVAYPAPRPPPAGSIPDDQVQRQAEVLKIPGADERELERRPELEVLVELVAHAGRERQVIA